MQVKADVAACANGQSRQQIYVLSNPDVYLSVCPDLYSIIGYNGCHGTAEADQFTTNTCVDVPQDVIDGISADQDVEDCPAPQPDPQALFNESTEWCVPAADSVSTQHAISVKHRPAASPCNRRRLPAKQLTMQSFVLRS